MELFIIFLRFNCISKTYDCYFKKNNINNILKLDEEDDYDELLCCISTLILECAKHNTTVDQLK